MEENAILELWRSHDKKVSESLILNHRNATEITRMKVRSLLGSMGPVKIFTLLVGLLWVYIVDTIIVQVFSYASPFFLFSAIVQVLLTKAAIGVYLYQLILINRCDISEPVAETQSKIARLRISTLWITKLLFLQLPVWSTFYLSAGMFVKENMAFIIIQVTITLLLTALAAWLFIQIKYENRNKKWFRVIFSGKEWEPLIRSMELLDDLEDLNNEKKVVPNSNQR